MFRVCKELGKFLTVAGLLLFTPHLVHSQEANRLALRVEGLHSGKGKVLCLLFATPDGFPLDAKLARAGSESSISQGTAVCEFRNLPPGRYAICGFHDENGNEELDLNRLGMPKEGIVASRNAPMYFGPPKFRDAVFDYLGGAHEVHAKMRY